MDEDPQGPAGRRAGRLSDTVPDDVPVAVAERSGFVESVHHGAVVVLDRDGTVAWSVGDVERPIYARSALKPLQAAAMLDAGLSVDDRLLAVVCASHDGRPEHVAAVRELLAGVGLDIGDLDNTPAWPLDAGAHATAVRDGGGPSVDPAELQWQARRDAGHGDRQRVVDGRVHGGGPPGAADDPRGARPDDGRRSTTSGVDGCGAPTPTVSLHALAGAVRELAVDGHAVHRAMTSYPDLVGGPTRDVTLLMRAVPGLLVKDGAEGVQVAALPDGRAVALKIADGAAGRGLR